MSLLRYATLGGDSFRDEYSLAFDGTDDYVDCGSDSSLDVGTSDFTACCWFKLETTADGVHHDIIGKCASSLATNTEGWAVSFNGNVGEKKIYFDVGETTGKDKVLSNAISYDRWYHVVVTRDNSGNSMKIYIDGVLHQEKSDHTANTLDDADRSFKIGGFDSARPLNANISDVAYYNSALTSSQVKTIYNGREPYNHKEGVASGNLQGWWRMGDGLENHSGSTIYDMSANSNNGTMTNMASDDFTGDTP